MDPPGRSGNGMETAPRPLYELKGWRGRTDGKPLARGARPGGRAGYRTAPAVSPLCTCRWKVT
jgi:hypothetical protein